jgi:Bifunctional DNA primase/polymerase, N-terminal
MSAREEMLRAALRYADAGWPVFPCKPNADTCPAPARCQCKAPMTPNGFKDAAVDPGVIHGWWGRWPGANVGLPTGEPGPDVLDVDVRENGSGFAALNRLKRAGLLTGARALIRTTGGGLHIYYTGTAQGCHALPRHHLDFKSGGGYILAPPSMVHGNPYEVLDHRPGTAALDWQAVKQLLDPPKQMTPARRRTLPGGELPPGVQRALTADATDRSVALHRLVGACVRAGLDEDAIRQLAGTYEPALEKYGPRLPAEVDRSLRRIGAI